MRLFTTLLAALIPATVNAQWLENVEFGSTVDVEWTYATDESSTQKREFVFTPDMEVELASDGRLNVEARVIQESVGELDEEKTQFQLREFTLENMIGSTFMLFGKQQIVWGKADGLKVLDVVNPQDWREFILDDFDDSRIPLWAVNLEKTFDDKTIQFITILEQQYHEYPEQGEAYAITSPLFVPEVPTGVDVHVHTRKEPKRVFKDADFGLRMTGFSSGWDYSLNYLYHYDDNAALFRQIVITPQGPQVHIRPEHKRSHLIGGSVSNAFGDLTIRSELGVSLDKYYSTNDLNDKDGVVKTNELAYVIGLDWFGFSDTLVSFQLFQSAIQHHEQEMLRDSVNTTATLLIEKDYLNDTLKSRILWLHGSNDNDGLVRPKLSYQVDDMVEVWLGADIFYGDQDGIYGQFKENDRVFIGTELAI